MCLRFDAVWRSTSQLESGRRVTVSLTNKPAHPDLAAAGGPGGQASDDKKCSRYICRVVNMEDVDAQRESGASGKQCSKWSWQFR